jgi:YbbR domain-containing protein
MKLIEWLFAIIITLISLLFAIVLFVIDTVKNKIKNVV